MKLNEEAATRKINKSMAATTTGRLLFSPRDGREDFDRGCDHVYGLLKDSHMLYLAGSFGTSVFISITAIEEIAKMEIASFRNAKRSLPANKRHDDLLFSHKAKHSIALQEVICIGLR